MVRPVEPWRTCRSPSLSAEGAPRRTPGRRRRPQRRRRSKRRSGLARRPALALDRPARGGDRRPSPAAQPAARVLLRRHRRRPVEDDRRRRDLAPVSDGSSSPRRSARSRSRESNPDVVYVGMGETELRGNIIQGDGVYKIDRRRQDVDARRPRGDAGDRPHPRAPDQPRHRLRRGARRSVRRRTPSAASSSHRRRQDMDASRCSATTRPARSISSMDAEATRTSSTPALWEVFRTPHSLSSGGPGSGLFKSTDGGDTWTELTKQPRAAEAARGARSASASPAPTRIASTRSSRRRTAACSCPTMPARRGSGSTRTAAPSARVLLHAHLRRPEGEGHRLHPQHRLLPLDRRRQDAPRTSASRTATTTICGSRRTIRSG